MRHADTKADAWNFRIVKCAQHDASDSGWPLILRTTQTKTRSKFVIGGAANNKWHACVRRLFCSSAKADNKIATKTACDFNDALRESAPGNMWLNAVQYDHVAGTFWVPNNHEVVFRPLNLSFAIFVNDLFRTLLREIEEWVWVDV